MEGGKETGHLCWTHFPTLKCGNECGGGYLNSKLLSLLQTNVLSWNHLKTLGRNYFCFDAQCITRPSRNLVQYSSSAALFIQNCTTVHQELTAKGYPRAWWENRLKQGLLNHTRHTPYRTHTGQLLSIFNRALAAAWAGIP